MGDMGQVVLKYRTSEKQSRDLQGSQALPSLCPGSHMESCQMRDHQLGPGRPCLRNPPYAGLFAGWLTRGSPSCIAVLFEARSPAACPAPARL